MTSCALSAQHEIAFWRAVFNDWRLCGFGELCAMPRLGIAPLPWGFEPRLRRVCIWASRPNIAGAGKPENGAPKL